MYPIRHKKGLLILYTGITIDTVRVNFDTGLQDVLGTGPTAGDPDSGDANITITVIIFKASNYMGW
jgi:hypothetical protein